MTMPHCPYYGFHAIPELETIASQGGNQCALIVESYSPCRMETRGDTPDFESCELNGSARAIQIAKYKAVELVPPKAPMGNRKELPE